MSQPIYLDYNATTPIDPSVADAMEPYFRKHFGNPSSTHAYGAMANKAVRKARKQVANLIGCEIDEIIFTSGGSESNNYALKGAALANRDRGNHIITSSIEHPAVLNVCEYLEENDFRVTYLPVDVTGLIDPEAVRNAIEPDTILLSIMHANNEIGTIQPMAEISKIAHARNIIVHSDCAQSVGKVAVNILELGVDLLTIAGHKIYAPKGIGALYVRSGTILTKLIHGADHEMNSRAGTENVMAIVGLGEACAIAAQDQEKSETRLRKLRDKLQLELSKRFPDVRINGHPEMRLPNTLSISFRGLEANTILAELQTVAASAGAACHSDRVEVSSVLEAISLPVEYAMGTIRFSIGRFTTPEEIRQTVEEVSRVISALYSSTNLAPAERADKIKLTSFTHGLGCACKVRPQVLEEVLAEFPKIEDKNVMVGIETSDDAAVYRLDTDRALVQTVDFFTPIVDDPFQFGEIAAANSLSDIYAMGAEPLYALSIVAFPTGRLPLSALTEIMAGARSKVAEAGISIVGGHTVEDPEPKFGLAVTGIVEPSTVVRNSTARPGDWLILTKPIGTGILATALKRGGLDSAQMRALVECMSSLNMEASRIMRRHKVQACTDVTGYGLVGHLLEMLSPAKLSATLYLPRIPLLPGARELATAGHIPGGSKENFEFTRSRVSYDKGISDIVKVLLNDAQTSGGLLIAVHEGDANRMLEQLKASSIKAAIIGQVSSQEIKTIHVSTKNGAN